MHDLESHDDLAIARQAAEWVVRRDRGFSAAEKCAFATWQEADPRHAVELQRIDGAWRGLDAISRVPELRELADVVVGRARLHRRTKACFRAAFATAAALALGIFGWQRRAAPISPPVFVVSENVKVLDSTLQRSSLPDGSMAELNGTSRIEVEFTPAERRVRLVEGEAHFIVEQDPDRPFFVTAGPVTVRAVGTAFNVRLATDAIEVLVTEGKVQFEHDQTSASGSSPASSKVPVSSPEPAAPAALVAGQRAIIDRGPAGAVRAAGTGVAINDVGRAEIDEALGWQTTRLIFNHTPLEEVVAGFNHYNRHQLTLGDPKLRYRALTGVFRADNLEGFIRLLKASVDVKAELRTPTETVLLPVR